MALRCRRHYCLGSEFRSRRGANFSEPDHHAGDPVRTRRQHLDCRTRDRRQDEPAAGPEHRGRQPPRRRRHVGTKYVAKCDPDGYTILLGYTGTLAIGPSLYRNVGYDPRKDFAPIG